MMSNEELARRIRAGEADLICQLWEQVRRLVFLLLSRFTAGREPAIARAGLTREDLEQESFLAFCDAINTYDSGRGYKFSVWLNYPLKKRINSALGLRTSRQDAMTGAASLDAETADGLTLLDALPDPASGQAFDNVLESVYREKLRADLDTCLDRLPPASRSVVKCRYFHRMTLRQAAAVTGVSYSWAREMERKALRKLAGARELQEYRADVISRLAYRGGLRAFRHSWYSSTERAAEKLVDTFAKESTRGPAVACVAIKEG
jgi:RNA polymerase sigma factor (sigma-70 family)